MPGRNVEVGIIGASLGGSSAALRLAQSGISVALFDRSAFPRRKACGEGLSIQGLSELYDLGLRDQVLSLSHVPFYGFRFFEERRTSEMILGTHMHGIGVTRTALDTLLLEGARRAGVQVHVGEGCVVSRQSDNTFLIETAGESYTARYLILATGAKSSLPQTLGVPTFVKSRSRCGLSIPLKHSKPHNQTTVDILVSSKMQACSTPVTPDVTTLSLFCSNDLAARLTAPQLPLLVAEVCDRYGIDAHASDSGLTVSGLGRVSRYPYHESVFVVGDAYRQLDPIGGMGMTLALVTGRLAADALQQILRSSHANTSEVLRSHDMKVNRAVRKLAGYTELTYWSLSTWLGRNTLGSQKAGRLAREVLLSMHRPSSVFTPYGLLSTLLIYSAGLW